MLEPPSRAANGLNSHSECAAPLMCFPLNGLICLDRKNSSPNTELEVVVPDAAVVLLSLLSGAFFSLPCDWLRSSGGENQRVGSLGPVLPQPHRQSLEIPCLKSLKQIGCETQSCSLYLARRVAGNQSVGAKVAESCEFLSPAWRGHVK